MSIRRWIAVCLFLCCISFLHLYCAKIVSPPGGPVDKTGPSVVSTIPENDTTGIAKGNRIFIEFSESIERKSVEGAVFISPRFAGELRYKWKDKVLTVILPDSLADSTTYVVNIGTAVSDMRRNKMDNSYAFAFSTGEKINRGKISGIVFQGSKPFSGATVAAYDFALPDSATQFDSVYPPYLTQSGSAGEYSLEFLPDGDYFVMAFVDKSKDQRFDFPREAFGLPDRPAKVAQGQVEPNINFYLEEQDTASVSILSTILTEDHLIKMRLSRKISSDSLRENLDKVFLIPSDSSIRAINPIAIKEQKGIISSTFTFYFDSLTDGKYRVGLERYILRKDGVGVSRTESSEFNIELQPDSNPPEIETVSHSGKTVFPSDSIIEIHFSEPIDEEPVGDDAVRVIDSDGSQCEIRFYWSDVMHLELHLAGPDWNKTYSLDMDTSLIIDLSGNKVGDSIMQYGFKTYDKDSMGSVSGEIAFASNLDTAGTPFLIFSTKSGVEIIKERVTGNQFDFLLPPGKYLLSGFIDRNKNDRQDYGSLFPFRYAETSSFYPDTIRVRARFETADIEFLFR